MISLPVHTKFLPNFSILELPSNVDSEGVTIQVTDISAALPPIQPIAEHKHYNAALKNSSRDSVGPLPRRTNLCGVSRASSGQWQEQASTNFRACLPYRRK
jgi:hypothetical protein